MNKLKKLIIVFLILSITLTLSGCSLFGSDGGKAKGPKQTLVIWQLFDDKEVFDPIIKTYQLIKANEVNVEIKYFKKEYKEYVEETTNALAAGQGPDIWLVRNDWLPRQYDKLSPMPEKLMTITQYKEQYPDVAANDNIIDNKIYGIPWSIDTLALYYNTKIFEETRNQLVIDGKISGDDTSTLVGPPNNWEDFINYTKLLTIKNGNEIKRAGSALGSANNIDKAEDILSALMLQNNTKMTSDDKLNATFNLPITKQSGENVYAGTNALEFYLNFSNPNKENYSWNSSLPNSIDAFINEQVAMMVNYGYIQQTLLNRAPTLRYETAPLPQVKDSSKAVDYASYWVETVTNNATNPDLAWDFILYVAKNNIGDYTSATKKPLPARPQDVAIPTVKERGNFKNSTFAFQLASAQDWYKGQYAQKVDDIFRQMIESSASGQALQNTIDAAASAVTTLLRKKGYEEKNTNVSASPSK